MIDGGRGYQVSIPSILIGKQDGDNIIHFLQ